MAISWKHLLTWVRLPPKSRRHLPWDTRPQAVVSEPSHPTAHWTSAPKTNTACFNAPWKFWKNSPLGAWKPPQHKLGVIFSLSLLLGKEKKSPDSDYCSLQGKTKPMVFSKIMAPAGKSKKHPAKSTARHWDLLSLENHTVWRFLFKNTCFSKSHLFALVCFHKGWGRSLSSRAQSKF